MFGDNLCPNRRSPWIDDWCLSFALDRNCLRSPAQNIYLQGAYMMVVGFRQVSYLYDLIHFSLIGHVLKVWILLEWRMLPVAEVAAVWLGWYRLRKLLKRRYVWRDTRRPIAPTPYTRIVWEGARPHRREAWMTAGRGSAREAWSKVRESGRLMGLPSRKGNILMQDMDRMIHLCRGPDGISISHCLLW